MDILSGGKLAVLVLAALAIVCYIALLPPHKRAPFSGKLYRLPPGPQGHFLLGNLPEWLRARNSGRLVPWVSHEPFHGIATPSKGPLIITLPYSL